MVDLISPLSRSRESRLREPLLLEVGRSSPRPNSLVDRQPLYVELPLQDLAHLLDSTSDRLAQDPEDLGPAMTDLFSGLWMRRATAEKEAWGRAIEASRGHRLCGMIHQEPFTARSFFKPRGYAGDAALIDYIYTRDCRQSESDNVTRLGEQLFSFIRDTPACAGVRTRRDTIATALDQLCDRVDHPRVLSVACGHLREAGLSAAVRAGRAGQIVGLDSDPLSIELLQREQSALGVTPFCGSIKSMFRGPLAGEKFDFVYSTGLYDYLDDRLAARLTHRMFEMLNPGGRLLVANFLPDIWCSGYMETFMDWHLIYRDAAGMIALTESIPPSEVAGCRTFVEDNENIIFLEVSKN